MSKIINDETLYKKIEEIEIYAWSDILQYAPEYYKASIERIDSTSLLLTKSMDIILFNRAIGFGVFNEAKKETLDKILQLYQANEIKNFAIQLTPFAKPKDISTWLEEYALIQSFDWVKVFRSTHDIIEVPTEFKIEQIDKKQAEVFAKTVVKAFNMPESLIPWLKSNVDMPNWCHYLAYDKKEAVSASALFIKDDIAWLGLGSTLPSHRKKGYQRAMMNHRIKEAKKYDCKIVCTETGNLPNEDNPSLRNMFRTGFQQAYLRANYILKKD